MENFQKEIKKDGKKEEYEALALNAEEEYDRMVSSVASPKNHPILTKSKNSFIKQLPPSSWWGINYNFNDEKSEQRV